MKEYDEIKLIREQMDEKREKIDFSNSKKEPF